MTMAELRTETMVLNLGPHHPSTHGVFRAAVELDGEVVNDVVPHLGYLHRGVEKLCEHKTYYQILPITDRLDYMAASYNNFAYCLSVEKLLGIEIPPRGQAIRVIIGELTRIFSHLFWLGTHAHDLGAMTPIFYALREREEIMNLFEMVAGGRLTPSYFRIGGLAADLPAGFEEKVRAFIRGFPEKVNEYEQLLTKNKIWLERAQGIGVLSPDEALALGISGPMLRASGVAWDIRKSNPYSGYDKYEFDLPVYHDGDVYSRYLVRINEMRQSCRICEQALDGLPEGAINADVPKVVLPSKKKTLNEIESLIRHFMIIEEGFKPPVGEVYSSVESPRGELGFYIVSDGGPKPYRLKIRPPAFVNLQALSVMAKGRLFSDLIAILSSIDIVLAEVDR
jgi:NADH-quinone oxidoreductase subunit D